MNKKIVLGLIAVVCVIAAVFVFKNKKTDTQTTGLDIKQTEQSHEEVAPSQSKDLDSAEIATKPHHIADLSKFSPSKLELGQELVKAAKLEEKWLRSKEQLEQLMQGGLLSQFSDSEFSDELLAVFDHHFNPDEMAKEYLENLLEKLSEDDLKQLIEINKDEKVQEFFTKLNSTNFGENAEEAQKFMSNWQENATPEERQLVESIYDSTAGMANKNIAPTITTTMDVLLKNLKAQNAPQDVIDPIAELNKSLTTDQDASTFEKQIKEQSMPFIALQLNGTNQNEQKKLAEKLSSHAHVMSQQAQADVAGIHTKDAIEALAPTIAKEVISQEKKQTKEDHAHE